MKKLGFTLAEILISMAIVGIVAAICIPTLGTNTRQQANIATLKVTASDFENAFGSLLIAHAADCFDDTTGEKWIKEELSNYIKINVTNDSDKLEGSTKNGCDFTLSFDGDEYATLVLDVNGNNNKPNKDKVDVFTLELDEYGQFTNLLDYLNKDDQKQS